jgi:hypothetical protein
MNGAAAVPDIQINNPKINNITTTGKSHHFFVWRKNCQSSKSKIEFDFFEASLSNSLVGILFPLTGQ